MIQLSVFLFSNDGDDGDDGDGNDSDDTARETNLTLTPLIRQSANSSISPAKSLVPPTLDWQKETGSEYNISYSKVYFPLGLFSTMSRFVSGFVYMTCFT